jgi:hypothetical protein
MMTHELEFGVFVVLSYSRGENPWAEPESFDVFGVLCFSEEGNRTTER